MMVRILAAMRLTFCVSNGINNVLQARTVPAAADTHARAIRGVLTAYLEAHPDSRPDARVRVARFSTTRAKADIVGPAAAFGCVVGLVALLRGCTSQADRRRVWTCQATSARTSAT